jgi:cytochrome c556
MNRPTAPALSNRINMALSSVIELFVIASDLYAGLETCLEKPGFTKPMNSASRSLMHRRGSRRRLSLALVWVWLAIGCGNDSARVAPSVGRRVKTPTLQSPVVASAVSDALCAHPAVDVVHDLFCAEMPPSIHSLADVQAGLGIRFLSDADADAGMPSADDQPSVYQNSDYAQVVLLAHSTSLSAALVSSINPRALILTGNTALAFTRGTQQVELISVDREQPLLNFYLVTFRQACNAAANGCGPGDLFTPRIESDWDAVALQDAEDLKNTPSDCRQCHQRARAKPMLLMRELEGPWTHFFGDKDDHGPFPEPTGGDLVRDYLSAKGDETYAGVPSSALSATAGFTLESAVPFAQPLVFDGSAILNERWPWSSAGYPAQAQRSVTWDAAYEAFKRGEQLAPPYAAPRATDPDKLAQLTAAYRNVVRNGNTFDALPDLADIFPDDAQTRAEIGLQVDPAATPAQMLVAACGTCHNDVLDQTISRAHFNIALSRMRREELDLAIARLGLPRGSSGAMPPHGRRQPVQQ